MDEGTVSIITPAYNAQHLLPMTLQSVQQQTYTDWELLIVDDCSQDTTAEVVEQAHAIDSRVRLLKHQVNQGPAGARQTALDHARGRYIAFLDSDDLWLPRKLELQIDFMEKTGAVLSFTQFRRINADGSSVGRLIDVPETLSYRGLLSNTAIATSTAMVDSKATGPLRMTRTYYDDYALWLGILRRGFPARGLREDLMRYRVLGQSVSRNKVRSARMVWRVYREVEKLDPLSALWYLGNYGARAVLKYRRF